MKWASLEFPTEDLCVCSYTSLRRLLLWWLEFNIPLQYGAVFMAYVKRRYYEHLSCSGLTGNQSLSETTSS